MRYFIDPFGCVKNQVDAENMMAHLDKTGWVCSQNAEDADVIIVNSCGFIESAKQESIDAVLGWRKLYPRKKILLAGCLAMRYEAELKESLTEIDGFYNLPHTATQRHREKLKVGMRPLLSLPGSAYVKISEGCDNCCSYCAIPLIRGRLKSRAIPDIVKECRTLLKRGIKELCIVGQDIGSYGTDLQIAAPIPRHPLPSARTPLPATHLPELLNAISKLQGHFWIRLLYIHPDHFPLQILDIMEHDQRFLPYFDIPFQHASTKILTVMNRHGNAQKYLALLKTIRSRLPYAVIRSTFLPGFPGETEEDFAALLDFQQKAQLDWLGCFAYSREEGTPAYSMKKQVPKKIAAVRKQIIEERQIPITEKNMERFVGQQRVVLIEEEIGADSNTNEHLWLGRLYCQAPEVDGAAVIAQDAQTARIKPQLGTLVPCKVAARRGIDLEVRLCYN